MHWIYWTYLCNLFHCSWQMVFTQSNPVSWKLHIWIFINILHMSYSLNASTGIFYELRKWSIFPISEYVSTSSWDPLLLALMMSSGGAGRSRHTLQSERPDNIWCRLEAFASPLFLQMTSSKLKNPSRWHCLVRLQNVNTCLQSYSPEM